MILIENPYFCNIIKRYKHIGKFCARVPETTRLFAQLSILVLI